MSLIRKVIGIVFVSCSVASFSSAVAAESAYLLESADQVAAMQLAIASPGRFTDEFNKQRQRIDAILDALINIPVPADAGGGYTHEVHKQNYVNMRMAGRLYLLTQDDKYLNYVKSHLNGYAAMYPSLPLHPKKKEQTPGKLFWQSLNEAMWLVHVIQAYDAVKDSLSAQEQQYIETQLFEPMVDYLSEQSPDTFNKVHNHGTWATAAVGMSGYVLDKPEWVEKSLYGLDLSGKGGFMRQLDELFSPQGYYNEGPYYQRFALLPFVIFAQAIDNNEPERKIFEHRDEILTKATNATVQLSYGGLFFGINDAIKDKGINTIELVHGIAIAYNLDPQSGLLKIAEEQDTILLTGYGLSVAQALDEQKQTAYPFESIVFSDGLNGDEGALVVLRQNQSEAHQTLVFKATSQGLGHGHFDKLHYMFYNQGKEIVYDYGAARFLNIEAKYGGHYLPENNAYAKQTIAHNTLIVDETSHFDGNTSTGNKYHPDMLFTELDEHLQISSASMSNAYDNIVFDRTMALVNAPSGKIFVIDILNVDSQGQHQYDLPVHFYGQYIDSNVAMNANTTTQSPLGSQNGYQYLWLQAQGKPVDELARVTWLKDSTFYSHSTVVENGQELLMVRIGANDPNFNLIANQALINRVKGAGDHQFLSVLEAHGEYNGAKEFTRDAASQITELRDVSNETSEGLTLIKISFGEAEQYVLAINANAANEQSKMTFEYAGSNHVITGNAELLQLAN
ncbi:heparinase II/III family protein [Glaciecola sp. SC05]|uniref:heparinase II/III domain-containing protein n=1 Tax=Glaciecola sp. SC05 TaxID=1987355 RepID=UPI0035290462